MQSRGLTRGLLISLCFALSGPPVLGAKGAGSAPPPEEARRLVVEAFESGRPSLLAPLLPANAKVHLSLRTIGPARGLYGGGQLVVLLQQFFSRCQPEEFRASPAERESPTAPVNLHGLIVCRSPEGEIAVKLNLVLEPSGENWRLSEVWETG